MNEKLSLLYVDDEPINLMVFEISFKRKYNVVTAISGYAGLDKLKEYPQIAVVISDMKMPGMNGIEFITEAKKNHPNVTFFILTGFDITEEITKALNDNLIHRYFNKPFNMKEIEFAIIKAVG